MSDAIAGVGAKFRRYSGAAWASIAEVNSITGPDMSRNTIDVTSLDTTGGYKEFIAGFRDPGSVRLSMNFTRDGYELMKNDFESDVIKDYEIILPDNDKTTLNFQGLVTELPLTVPTDDKVTCDITIKISGSVSLNSGSGSG